MSAALIDLPTEAVNRLVIAGRLPVFPVALPGQHTGAGMELDPAIGRQLGNQRRQQDKVVGDRHLDPLAGQHRCADLRPVAIQPDQFGLHGGLHPGHIIINQTGSSAGLRRRLQHAGGVDRPREVDHAKGEQQQRHQNKRKLDQRLAFFLTANAVYALRRRRAGFDWRQFDTIPFTRRTHLLLFAAGGRT